MNDTFYFSHDYNARTDEKVKKLFRKHGIKGYGLYWAIVEDLYQNANALHLDYEGIAFDYRCEESLVKYLIEETGLFHTKNGKFYSKSIEKRLKERDDKSAKARESAMKRWGKGDANAKQSQSDSNAIKERKGKERKIKMDFFKKNQDTQLHKYIDKELPLYLLKNPGRKVTEGLLNEMKNVFDKL